MAENFSLCYAPSTDSMDLRVTLEQATNIELFWSDVIIRKITSAQLAYLAEMQTQNPPMICANQDGEDLCVDDDELLIPGVNSDSHSGQTAVFTEKEASISLTIVDMSIAIAKQQFAREEFAKRSDIEVNVDPFVKHYLEEIVASAVLVYFGVGIENRNGATKAMDPLLSETMDVDSNQIDSHSKCSIRIIDDICASGDNNVINTENCPSSFTQRGDFNRDTDAVPIINHQNREIKVSKSRTSSFLKLFRKKCKSSNGVNRAGSFESNGVFGTIGHSESKTIGPGRQERTGLSDQERNNKLSNEKVNWFKKLKRRLSLKKRRSQMR